MSAEVEQGVNLAQALGIVPSLRDEQERLAMQREDARMRLAMKREHERLLMNVEEERLTMQREKERARLAMKREHERLLWIQRASLLVSATVLMLLLGTLIALWVRLVAMPLLG